MPYIKEEARVFLDECIEKMTECLTEGNCLTDDEYLSILGEINYCFSRILGGAIGNVSYGKIAMTTGVLENIKQEFYRRVAEPYENIKITENGDIREYAKYKRI